MSPGASFLSRCLLAICCAAAVAAAQSGRRSTPTEPPQPPVQSSPTPTERSPRPPQDKQAQPALPLIVGINSFTASFDNLSGRLSEYAYGACVERLRASAALAVTASGTMTRREAIDRAKIQTEGYVVWLEAAVDSMNRAASDPSLSGRGDGVFVEFTIFTAQTAKVKGTGRVYLDTVRAAGSGPVGINLPTISRRMPVQYRLEMAGEEAADRVMARLGVVPPRSNNL